MLIAILLTLFAGVTELSPSATSPSAGMIVQRSVEANQIDRNAAPQYDYSERDGGDNHSKTYKVLMIDGSPYRQLVQINSEPLPSEEQQNEENKLHAAITRRQAESAAERARRVANFEKDLRRDDAMLRELTKAFDFRLAGEGTIDGRKVYILRASPRPGYQPPNPDTAVLTGMRGELWIDTSTYQWVKVTAQVVHPVSIDGFLARVEPGTFFELEKMPVGNGIWLPKHFVMRARSRILGLFGHHDSENQTYFDYRKADPRDSRLAHQ